MGKKKSDPAESGTENVGADDDGRHVAPPSADPSEASRAAQRERGIHHFSRRTRFDPTAMPSHAASSSLLREKPFTRNTYYDDGMLHIF